MLSGSFRCHNCCWFKYIKRIMFAIKWPTFWKREGVNQYNSIIEQNQCVYIWRKYDTFWSLEPVCSHSFTHLRVWRCAESMVVLHVKVNLCFWGGHFTDIHTFYEWKQFFPNVWFINLVLKIHTSYRLPGYVCLWFISINFADKLKTTAIQSHDDYCGTLVTVWSYVGCLLSS